MDDRDDCGNGLGVDFQMSFVDLAILDDVNYKVNHSLRYKTDSVSHYQKADESRRLGTGDCEDYAILKAQELKEAGVDVSLLTIAVCTTRRSDTNHAVLLVPSRRRVGIFKRRWEDTTVVLDNYNDTIYRFENTGYTIVEKYPASRWVV